MPAIMHEYRRSAAAGLGVVVDVNNVDNELTISLNGQLLTWLGGPGGQGDSYNRNITDQLDAGENLLTFTAVNFDDNSPASLDASVSIGAEKINLNQSSLGGVPQGLYYQAFVYIDR